MRICYLHILIGLIYLSNFISPGQKALCWNPKLTFTRNNINEEETFSGLTNKIDEDSTIKLIQPAYQVPISTFTPEFSWHALKSDSLIEYRLLIAKPDGKIIFDKWIGQDTSYTIPTSNMLEDLTPYYWTVYASCDNQQVQSPVWSFWIDQNIVADLTVTDIVLLNDKKDWNPGDQVKIQAIIQNSGPINSGRCTVTLYSGNINRNYWDYSAYRKTMALDTVFISELIMNVPKSVTLTARLPYGFNNFFVCISPGPGIKDIIDANNFLHGIKIQTENRILCLNGLFIIYKNYSDPEIGAIAFNQHDLTQLIQNIINFQRYFWDHTSILQINVDTLHVNRLLADKNFTYQNEQWGYFLSPEEIKVDLRQQNITELDYDFVFVYYLWWNSAASWSGYSGYSFKNLEFFNKKIPILAQPIIYQQIEDESITIHEFLHLLDHHFEESGEPEFYSPHHRMLYTTFENDKDYFDWILETWPTSKWFNLKHGELVDRKQISKDLKPINISFLPKILILSQNYPNPFNKITNIIYRIPYSKLSSTRVKVTLIIYDVLGNRIRTLINETQRQGTFRVFWDGKDQNGNEVTSGIYFYELKAGEQRQVKKLVFIR